MPERIQRRMAKDWRKPEGAVYVGRPGKWGNPIHLSDVAAQYPSLDTRQVATMVVRDFELLARRGSMYLPNWLLSDGARTTLDLTYPPVWEIRAELAGHDLMCWCPLEDAYGSRLPCHADVLLAIANGGDDRG